jgi:hypothetical protein
MTMRLIEGDVCDYVFTFVRVDKLLKHRCILSVSYRRAQFRKSDS